MKHRIEFDKELDKEVLKAILNSETYQKKTDKSDLEFLVNYLEQNDNLPLEDFRNIFARGLSDYLHRYLEDGGIVHTEEEEYYMEYLQAVELELNIH